MLQGFRGASARDRRTRALRAGRRAGLGPRALRATRGRRVRHLICTLSIALNLELFELWLLLWLLFVVYALTSGYRSGVCNTGSESSNTVG